MDKLTIAYILEVQSLIQLICNLKFSSKHIKKVKETGKGNLRAVYITLTRLALQKEGLCTVSSPQVFDTRHFMLTEHLASSGRISDHPQPLVP